MTGSIINRRHSRVSVFLYPDSSIKRVIISSIEIEHFRAIKELEIEFEELTILLGSNGTGKTTVLDALAIFFTKKKADNDDFHKNMDSPIRFTVEFDSPSAELLKYLSNNKLCMEISKKDNNISQVHYRNFPHFKLFDELDSLTGIPYKNKYNELCLKISDLSECNIIGDMKNNVTKWKLSHSDECDDHVREIIPKTFLNYVELVFVENDDPSIYASEGKSPALTELVNLIIRESSGSKQLQELDDNLRRMFVDSTNSENFSGLHDLSNGITSIINQIDDTIHIDINWKNDYSVEMPKPKAEVKIKESDFFNTIEKSGQGVQRLFLYAILLYYSKHKNLETATNSNRILIIDEPELHQHPIRQEAFYKILNDLSKDMQIIYTTHSQKFISISNLSKMWFFTKPKNGIKSKNISLKKLSKLVKTIDESQTPEKIEKHLRSSHTSVFLESLFSKAVVLVEGVSDAAIINSVAKCMIKDDPKKNNLYKDLSILGISIVPCSGKSNIREQITLFRELNIPVYVVWDLDLNKPESKKRYCEKCGYKIEHIDIATDTNNEEINKMIYKYICIKIPDKFKTDIKPTFACFEKDIEEQLHNSISSRDFNKYRKDIESSYDSGFSEKNPDMVSDLIGKIYESNRIPNIEKIVNYIIKLPKLRKKK